MAEISFEDLFNQGEAIKLDNLPHNHPVYLWLLETGCIDEITGQPTIQPSDAIENYISQVMSEGEDHSWSVDYDAEEGFIYTDTRFPGLFFREEPVFEG